MAVVPMKRLELFALRRDRKAILELLQRRGVVEVESTQASGCLLYTSFGDCPEAAFGHPGVYGVRLWL